MRVVHVVSEIGTYGGERLVEALARAQRRIGIDAVVLAIYEPARVPEDLPILSAGRRRNGARARGGGPAFFFRLVHLLRALRPDVVHTHLAHAKHWGRLAALFARARCVVHTEHGNAFDEGALKRGLTRLLHRGTARVCAFSQVHAQRIAQHEGVASDRLAVIPNGIELDALRVRRSRDRTTRSILAIGRLEPVKGYDGAIEALALLPPEIHLTIAGEGSARESLVRQAKRLGVGERLHLLGYRRDVMTLLGETDLVLNTSHSEAMPLSLIEALCAGARVVSTPWPGAQELARHGARLSHDFSPASIARAIETALGEAPPSGEQVAAAREHFSIERVALEYAGLYAACRPGLGYQDNGSEVPPRTGYVGLP